MLGDKFSLLFWNKPKEDGIDWRVQLTGAGDLILDGIVLNTEEHFEFTFDREFSYELTSYILRKLGFTPKVSE